MEDEKQQSHFYEGLQQKLMQYNFYELINDQSKPIIQQDIYKNDEYTQVVQNQNQINNFLIQDMHTKKAFMLHSPLTFQILLENREIITQNRDKMREYLSIINPYYSVNFRNNGEIHIKFKTFFQHSVYIEWNKSDFKFILYLNWNEIDKWVELNKEECLDRIFRLLSLIREVYDINIIFSIQLNQADNQSMQNQIKSIQDYQNDVLSLFFQIASQIRNFRMTTLEEQFEFITVNHGTKKIYEVPCKGLFYFRYEESSFCECQIIKHSQQYIFIEYQCDANPEAFYHKYQTDNSFLGNLTFIKPYLETIESHCTNKSQQEDELIKEMQQFDILTKKFDKEYFNPQMQQQLDFYQQNEQKEIEKFQNAYVESKYKEDLEALEDLEDIEVNFKDL